ncbi:LURP-one-related/scramblase family protein [Haloarchaeobius sp. DFWS5]|uniref:LURP-one-related/scramblase family protein n=1 Tax=Haloarchaeobius sp. DFWS5 TaxID=3446114 RepID=UPI003EB6C168
MTQKLLTIGDDYFVEDQSGQQRFHIDGKALRVRDTLYMTDRQNQDVYKFKERVVRIKDTMTISKNGQDAATVQKALITPLRDRFTVSVAGGKPLEVKGNVLDHEYKLLRNGERVAEVSKRWFRVRDSYGIEVSPEFDQGLAVACAVAIDMIAHPNR